MASQVEHIKWVPGTPFMVDGFRFQNERCCHYFLTHSHGDHTTGLNKSFSAGKIYCTPITAKLLIEESGISAERITAVELDEPIVIHGCVVTPICANHCPGACMFLFQLKGSSEASISGSTTVLHTGDFRFHDGMPSGRSLLGVQIDILMLDTTYSTPKWTFPDQARAIKSAAEIIDKAHADDPGTAFIFNAYHIGKERCYFQVALECGLSVWVSARRLRTLKRLQLSPKWMNLITSEKCKAGVIVSDQGVRPEQLQSLQCELGRPVIGFQCTGWGYQKSGIKKRVQNGTLCYSIPYSEHSSWPELRRCVKAFAPKRLIPTVNVGDKARFDGMVAKFADLMDLRESKGHIDRFLIRSKLRKPTNIICCAKSASAGKLGTGALFNAVNAVGNRPCDPSCPSTGVKRDTPDSWVSCDTEAGVKFEKAGDEMKETDCEDLWEWSACEYDVCELFDLNDL
eukprot:jgi/Ulvmu1/7652/UM038_0081.1